MGLYGIMNTSVSGMNAQSNKLSTVADNISNANTVGYKRYKTAFSSLVGSGGGSGHESGIVNTTVVQSVRQQGAFNFTSRGTDLAINGNGFFPVQDSQGGTYYTRAGDFVLDKNGQMVNSGGYNLLSAGGAPVTVDLNTPVWQASAKGELAAKLDSNKPAPASVPTSGLPDGDYRTSVSTFDQSGNEVKINIVYTKASQAHIDPTDLTSDVTGSTWIVEATAATDLGDDISIFPPAVPPAPAGAFQLHFTGDGKIVGGSDTDFQFKVPNGEVVTLDLSKSVTASEKSSIIKVDVDGYKPSAIQSVRIESDGRIFGVYDSSAEKLLDQIQIVNFSNPDGLQAKSGNVYAATDASGDAAIGFPGDSGFGSLYSGAVEGSNVDLAAELTEMVQAQRTYSANTKVFNASSELLQELNNLR
ncbi:MULTISPECIES: flagellar hook protein FlgE [unclassified Pseudovibrio]|uniref:flagellar hook protein FlgE n=1 Tax=unclassified Pseudovibrio TaxID=2627060 RepID=UPI0007AEB8D6|nr:MULTISPECIES: flagellar hook protein FlgE [unclassified Pseudovibrio]KZL24870.1 Flagellar hook protein FlgE [Pseudovibrio sp. Ad37]KZL28285.1 Flagellar hook protein FlgE [Pseudovibrio sp. WM33]